MIDCGVNSYNTAVVLFANNDVFRVQTDDGILVAKKAFSCLINPCQNDVVAIFTTIQNEHYIISILERKNDNSCEIHFLANTKISANEIEFISKNTTIASSNFELTCTNASINSKDIQMVSEKYSNSAIIYNRKCLHENLKADKSYKFVHAHEEKQSGSFRHLTQDSHIIKSQNLVATANSQVKIDGENIHLG